ncbi:MAG TPA: hypothetical protein PKW06_15200, partial [Cyclobacteriaceae bacterium]|nr:hypothetical protein [Cyclobacteriaceae bacterium]
GLYGNALVYFVGELGPCVPVQEGAKQKGKGKSQGGREMQCYRNKLYIDNAGQYPVVNLACKIL